MTLTSKSSLARGFIPRRDVISTGGSEGNVGFLDSGGDLAFKAGFSYDANNDILSLPPGGSLEIGDLVIGGVLVSPLDVRAVAGAAGTLLLSTAEPTVVTGDIIGRIDFQAPLESSGGDAITVAASIWCEAGNDFFSTSITADLVFATGDTESASEKMRLTSAGNLHLYNSTNPSLELSEDSGTSYIRLQAVSGLQFKLDAKSANNITNALLDINVISGDGTDLQIVRFFRNSNSSGGTYIEVMLGNNSTTKNARIGGQGVDTYFCSNNGDFGIGAETNPAAKLHVFGTMKVDSHLQIVGDINHDGSKLGFFGVLPLNRPDNTEDIKAALVSLGLLQGGVATPLDLEGGKLTCGEADIDGNLNHDGSRVGLYGVAPAVQSDAYSRTAVIIEDRTLVSSASANATNNNQVLAALIGDLQSRGFIG